MLRFPYEINAIYLRNMNVATRRSQAKQPHHKRCASRIAPTQQHNKDLTLYHLFNHFAVFRKMFGGVSQYPENQGTLFEIILVAWLHKIFKGH